MSNVTEFPSQFVREWGVMERGILDITRQAGVDDEVASVILARIKPLFEILSEDVVFTIVSDSSSPAQIENDALSMFLKKQSERILWERIYREIDACKQLGVL